MHPSSTGEDAISPPADAENVTLWHGAPVPRFGEGEVAFRSGLSPLENVTVATLPPWPGMQMSWKNVLVPELTIVVVANVEVPSRRTPHSTYMFVGLGKLGAI
jgi:hypothetical protein